MNASDPEGIFALALSDSGASPTNIDQGSSPGTDTTTGNSPTILVSAGNLGYWQFSASTTVSGPDASPSCGIYFDASTGEVQATATINGTADTFSFNSQDGFSATASNGSGASVSVSGEQVTVTWPVSVDHGKVTGTVSIQYGPLSQNDPSDGYSYQQVIHAPTTDVTVAVLTLLGLGRIGLNSLRNGALPGWVGGGRNPGPLPNGV